MCRFSMRAPHQACCYSTCLVVSVFYFSTPLLQCIRTLSGIDPLPLHVSKAHAVEIYGISYRIGVAVRLPPKAKEPPVFGHITAIYVLSDIKYFVVEVFYIHVFVLHFWGAKGAPILFSEIGFCMASCSYIIIYIYILYI